MGGADRKSAERGRSGERESKNGGAAAEQEQKFTCEETERQRRVAEIGFNMERQKRPLPLRSHALLSAHCLEVNLHD